MPDDRRRTAPGAATPSTRRCSSGWARLGRSRALERTRRVARAARRPAARVPDHPHHRHERQDQHQPHHREHPARARPAHRAVHEPAPGAVQRAHHDRRRADRATRRSPTTGTTSQPYRRPWSTPSSRRRASAPLTFFEVLTVLAFACFADAPVDVAVHRGRHGRRVGLHERRPTARSPCSRRSPSTTPTGSAARSPRSPRTKAGHHQAGRGRRVGARRTPEPLAELRARGRAHGVDDRRSRARDFALVEQRRRRRRPADHGARARRHLRRRVPAAVRRPPGAERRLAIAAVESFIGGGDAARSPATSSPRASATATSPGRLQLVGIEPDRARGCRAQPARRARRSSTALARATSTSTRSGVVLGVLADKDAEGIIAALAPVAAHVSRDRSPSSERADRRRRPRRPRARADARADVTVTSRHRWRPRRGRARLGRRGADAAPSSSPARSRSSAKRSRSPTDEGWKASERDATPPAASRAARRARGAASRCASIVLGFESIVVFLGGARGLRPRRCLTVPRGGASAAASSSPPHARRPRGCCATAGASGSAGRCRSSSSLGGFLVPRMFIVGAIFAAHVGVLLSSRAGAARPPQRAARRRHPPTEPANGRTET